MLAEGLEVMRRWGFTYKTNLVWFKIRRDGGPDGRGVGFYFRNVTELVLFGTRGRLRTLKPGRTQTNLIATRKREHSRKSDELYDVIERCSPGPYLELFARNHRRGWTAWGDEALDGGSPSRPMSPNYTWGPDVSTSGPVRAAQVRIARTLGRSERRLADFSVVQNNTSVLPPKHSTRARGRPTGT